jgi:acetyl-CoA C-acetyltransferase
MKEVGCDMSDKRVAAHQGEPSVIINGARTPMGRLQGALKSFSGADLGGMAIKGALEKAGVGAGEVDYVIMGQVLQAGAGQITARQAAVKAGISMDIPALTINKVCLSGLDAIALADQLIRAGEAECIVAGGMESMTNAPHLLMGSREGTKFGDWNMVDSMAFDGLTCAFDQCSMGEATDNFNSRYQLTREAQDNFAALSHTRAANAQKAGIFESEIVTIEVPQRKGDPVLVSRDEGIRAETTVETLGNLRPAFNRDGTVTAGNASQISDGAAAVIVMSKAKAKELGVSWLAEIGAHGNVAGPDSSLHEQPARAILSACNRAGIDPADIDLFEINEAFAAIGLVSMDVLTNAGAKADSDHVNVNGGAIALGHPIGMSGARLVLHLAHELRRRGGGIGAAALCGGGGQGDALLIRVADN